MAMRMLTAEEFAAELNGRRCKKLKDLESGYSIWEDEQGEPFTVPPPEEWRDNEKRYPDWMLDDLIREVGLPADRGPATH